jgi:hypothetical protein
MKRTPGLVSVRRGAARADSPADFAMVMLWQDLASLKALVGEDHTAAHVAPAEAEIVAARPVRHYDLVDG